MTVYSHEPIDEVATLRADNERLRAALEAAESDGEAMRQVRLQLYAERDTLRGLLQRCVEPVQDSLHSYEDERARYDGYPSRQARYDLSIADLKALQAELIAVTNDKPTAILWEQRAVDTLLEQLEEGEPDDRACAYAATLIREALPAMRATVKS
jgi:DNA repair exonuclease SbcCD ATPase subunit